MSRSAKYRAGSILRTRSIFPSRRGGRAGLITILRFLVPGGRLLIDKLVVEPLGCGHLRVAVLRD